MKCIHQVVCGYLKDNTEPCGLTEICQHCHGVGVEASGPEKPKKACKRKSPKPSKKVLDPTDFADLIIARRQLIYKVKCNKVTADTALFIQTLTDRHVKTFTTEERERLIDAAKNG